MEKNLKKNIFIIPALLMLLMTGCLDDDEYSPELVVSDQIITQNAVFVERAEINRVGWLAIYPDDGSTGPDINDLAANPISVSNGFIENFFVTLAPSANLMDNKRFWLMLHYDTDDIGLFEYDGGDADEPVSLNGNDLMEMVAIEAPAIEVADQSIDQGQITVDLAKIGIDGWVVIHEENENGAVGDVIGITSLPPGENQNIQVEMQNTEKIMTGDKLYAMLHINQEPLETFDFPGVDNPEVFGYNEDDQAITVLAEFNIQ